MPFKGVFPYKTLLHIVYKPCHQLEKFLLHLLNSHENSLFMILASYFLILLKIFKIFLY